MKPVPRPNAAAVEEVVAVAGNAAVVEGVTAAVEEAVAIGADAAAVVVEAVVATVGKVAFG
jgi:hypothetical protein